MTCWTLATNKLKDSSLVSWCSKANLVTIAQPCYLNRFPEASGRLFKTKYFWVGELNTPPSPYAINALGQGWLDILRLITGGAVTTHLIFNGFLIRRDKTRWQNNNYLGYNAAGDRSTTAKWQRKILLEYEPDRGIELNQSVGRTETFVSRYPKSWRWNK